MSDSLLTLWNQAWPKNSVLAYPTFELLRSKGKERTFEISSKTQLSSGKFAVAVRERRALKNELLHDQEMRYRLDVSANLAWRINLYHEAENDPARQAVLAAMCKSNVLFFINAFVWITNPRDATVLPFVTFPFQDDLIGWMLSLLDTGQDGIVEKSREMGYTWCAVSVATYLLFYPYMTVYLMSLTENDVDNRTLDSLFGKLRFILNGLPAWMRQGWIEKGDTDRQLQIGFPSNGSQVSGKLSRGTMRGGRAFWMVWDEAAHAEQDSKVRAALVSLARATIIGSTPIGAANEFYEMAHDPRFPKMTLHNSLHPQKNEAWRTVEYNRPTYTPEILAQEQEISYETSTEGRVFPQLISASGADIPWSHVQDDVFTQYDPNLPVDVAADLGTSDPCAVLFIQIKPMPGFWRQYTDLTETIVVFSEFKEKGLTAFDLRYLINAREYPVRHTVVDLRTGDNRDPSGNTWRTNLANPAVRSAPSRRFGRIIDPGPPIITTGQRSRVDTTILNMRELLNIPGALVIAKRGAPEFIRAMQNWSYPVDPVTREARRDSDPTHPWSDYCKAFLYYLDWRKSNLSALKSGRGVNVATPRRVYR